MADAWINKAHRYIASHGAFSEVSGVLGPEGKHEIHAVAVIELPSRFSRKPQTDLGVRNREFVRFVFPPNFPLEAPRILLRNDFPRVFPHINPSADNVEPCIYAGSLSELLQQPGWMNEVLNQLVDWLYKAAANDLINLEQGWEPMRSDNVEGYIVCDDSALEDITREAAASVFSATTSINQINGKYFVGRFYSNTDSKPVLHIFRSTPGIINEYIPNPIRTLGDLYQYADSVGISRLQGAVNHAASERRSDKYIVVTLGIRRPTKLIGKQRSIEFITFLVCKQNKGKKLTLANGAEVLYLAQISESSPEILRRLSGTKNTFNPNQFFAILGCGSVGSKIALHLARNGAGPFLLVDDDIFLPHNSARHGLFSPNVIGKADLLDIAIRMISPFAVNKVAYSAFDTDYTKSSFILDSTASLPVRSFLMRNIRRPPLVSVALFDHGKIGLVLIEAKHQRAILCDIWAFLYKSSMSNGLIARMLFTSQTEAVSIGQSCRSSTLVVSDSVISLYAASFSIYIQKLLEETLPRRGEILIAVRGDDDGIHVDRLEVPEYIDVSAKQDDPLSVRIEKSVVEKMKSISDQYAPNEIGGVLIGTVFQNANRVVITDILDAPKDSKISPSSFTLGIDGLEEQIYTIETKSHERITYLGTWHSHPISSGPSKTDLSTLERLECVRDREPTICLIHSSDGVQRV